MMVERGREHGSTTVKICDTMELWTQRDNLFPRCFLCGYAPHSLPMMPKLVAQEWQRKREQIVPIAMCCLDSWECLLFTFIVRI